MGGVLGFAAATAALVACVDLFHSTSGLLDQCQIDAASCPIDFCALDKGEPESYAQHACAWLGACASPLGRNAFGSCTLEARLAFDCEINPNHRVSPETHDLWQCLARAQSCAEVHACVDVPESPEAGPPTCMGAEAGSPACRSAGAVSGRVSCDDPEGGVENCALWSQTCVAGDSPAACGGSPRRELSCSDGYPGACDPSAGSVHWCTPQGEVGVNCTEGCGAFPDSRGDAGVTQWVACIAQGDASCAPTTSIACSPEGVASSCPSGVHETIDCARLLGEGGSCALGLQPPFDWKSACVTPGGCTEDGCDGGTLTGCANGASFSVDCHEAGLGDCRWISVDGTRHAACGAP
jgi:hypothetical protein